MTQIDRKTPAVTWTSINLNRVTSATASPNITITKTFTFATSALAGVRVLIVAIRASALF